MFRRRAPCLCIALCLALLGPCASQADDYVGTFLVTAPVVERAEPDARALLPDTALYDVFMRLHVGDLAVGYVVGQTRLLWRPSVGAYAFALPPEPVDALVLYRLQVLTGTVLLWQRIVSLALSGQPPLYQIVLTYQPDDRILVIGIRLDVLKPILRRHDVAYVALFTGQDAVDDPAPWKLIGRPEDIRAALAEAVRAESVAYDTYFLPAIRPEVKEACYFLGC